MPETPQPNDDYRLLFEFAPVGVTYTDADGRIRDCNAALATLLGYTRDELRGRTWSEVSHPDELELNLRLLDEVRRGVRDEYELDKRYVRKDGTLVWAHVTSACVRDADGGVRHLVAVVQDIDGRRHAEEALARVKHQYETLLDTIPDPAWLKDPRTTVLACNEALARLLGRPRERVVGRSNAELLPPAEAERTTAKDRTVLVTGEPVTVEEVMASATGEARLYETIRTPFRDPGGGWAGTAGIARDITDRKATEERLRLLSAAVEQSPSAIIVTDTDGAIVYVNRRLCETTGYRREELVGRTPAVFRSGAHDDAFYREMWTTILAGRQWRGEMRNRRKDGSVSLELTTISPVFGADERITHFVAVKEDLSELRALEQRLIQAQKLEAVGRLAGGVAHDFNNMLTAISGFGELIRPELPPDSPPLEYLDQIVTAAQRSARVTTQLLAFSRRQIVQPERVEVNAVIRELEAMLLPLIGDAVELRLRLTGRPTAVVMDRAQLEQVILNLVLNAREAMPEGGRLELGTQTLTGRAPEADTVELEVADTGRGMAPELLERVFEPFFTTKPAGRGSGLGLSTVYGIVRQSDGHVDIDSEPDAGTRVRVRLPAAGSPSPEVAAHPARPSRAGRSTVLVVEDEEPVRRLVARVLERGGYRVLAAADGEAGLALAGTEPVDLLLTDVVMPGMSGRVLADRIHQDRPGLPVLYMSGYTEDDVLRHGIRRREVQFLEKPFSTGRLLEAVAAALGNDDTG